MNDSIGDPIVEQNSYIFNDNCVKVLRVYKHEIHFIHKGMKENGGFFVLKDTFKLIPKN